MKKTVLIMAGGRGERFWPRSRVDFPKQFLTLIHDEKTMIQLTVERVLSLVDIEDIFVVTNSSYKTLVQEQLPDLPEENILCEPLGKNTAACIGLGAIHIQKKYDDALMIVLASDHLIKCRALFIQTIEKACQIAEVKNRLVTLGIAPDYPETGYGYIKFDSKEMLSDFFAVESFVEKPTLEVAKEYVNSGDYLWNSGMFIWKTSSIMLNFNLYLTKMYESLLRIKNAIGSVDYENILKAEFLQFDNISIDCGIMEKANQIYTIPCTFGWDDVGSWISMERNRKCDENGCVMRGNILNEDSFNCIVDGSKKLIAIVGVENLIIVDSQNAILVCEKKSTEKIKGVLKKLRSQNKKEYL